MEVGNLIFTSIFTLELVIKLSGLGPRAYFLDWFNILDFAVVVVSLAEVRRTFFLFFFPPRLLFSFTI
jgi:hypothetical protein